MEPTTTSDPKCFRCELPALTFDEKHRPLCGRHATIFLSDIRAKVFGNNAEASEKASVEPDPKPAMQEYGFHLRLVPAPGSGPDEGGGETSDERSENDH